MNLEVTSRSTFSPPSPSRTIAQPKCRVIWPFLPSQICIKTNDFKSPRMRTYATLKSVSKQRILTGLE
jgi:hypothetical protein